MGQTADLIAARLASLGRVPSVVAAVFGDASPEGMEAALDAFCREHLGAGLVASELWVPGRGSVHGLRLDDGRRVVVKLRGPDVPVRFLAAAQNVQRTLHQEGYPAPEPRLGPVPFGAGHATAEALLDAGEHPDGHDGGVRHAMAAALADFVARCERFAELDGIGDHPWRLAPGALWPVPHDARYAFAPGDAGAEWIDAIAARAIDAAALREGGAGRLVVGHGDWRAQNLRFDGDALTAVYDWDSLALDRECALLGGVAHYFCTDWEVPGRDTYPSFAEALEFVASYEAARCDRFSQEELRAICATIAYSMAYSARCEHADDPAEERPPGSARAFLAANADRLL